MNVRHIALYEYLLEKGDTWTPQVQVARDLYREFGNDECCLAPETYHDTTERKILSRAISEINESPDFEKIIISSGKGIKIANCQEAEVYIKNHYRSVFRKLKRVREMERKCKLHNQIDVEGNTIDAFIEKAYETL